MRANRTPANFASIGNDSTSPTSPNIAIETTATVFRHLSPGAREGLCSVQLDSVSSVSPDTRTLRRFTPFVVGVRLRLAPA